MKEQNSPYLDKLKQNLFQIFILIFIVYSTIIASLYKYYNAKVEIEKTQILQNQYNKILAVSMNKISSLAYHLSSNIQEKNVTINSNGSELEICNEAEKCINYNLFNFGALLNQHVPVFIYYKIELNKKFLYSNIKTQNYQIDKIYPINASNQLNISLAINSTYWHKVKADIKRPFWILTAFITANLLLLYFLFKSLFKSFNKSYALHYQDKHATELEQLKFNYQQELKNCETSLMRKIWNNDFNKQKDLEINCLFAQEANQISLLDKSSNNQEDMIKDYRLKNFGDKVPCSILLYQENKIEEINASKLVDLFTDRFNQEDENISIEILSKAKVLYFASNAALYQIIYSIINYLFFLLKKQSSTTKHNIRLTIDDIKQKIELRFEYDGYPIMTAEELLKTSNHFFKTHANPFLLNLSQVFNILRADGFNYKISYNQSNIIEIYPNDSSIRQENKSNQQPIKTENNVIILASLTRKKMNKYLLPLMVLFIVNNSFAHTQISNLITPVSYFINHEQQIKMLDEYLSKYRQASIVGTSGIGKTQLIRMYTYENKNNYDLIWLFDCNLDLNEQFVKLAQQLNMVKQTNISEAVTLAKKEVMSYLTSTSKWLLVFDNLKVNENKKVQNFIDWEHNGQVVFCSQNNERLPNVILMTLFDKPTIVTLANTLLDNKDKNSIEFLTQSFSGYPILIVQGIQLLNKIKGLDKEEYKKKIYQSTDKIATNISMAIKELKPSAVKLLNKIALINNQSFSKQLLAIITDNKNTLDDDIYQLSKFMLISNIDSNQDNPIFEMNDVVSNKIMEINGDKNNKICLEDIILKLPKLKGVHSAHVWRATKTISENLEIIFQNAEKYNINIYLMLNLRLQLFASYMNAWNLYKSKPMVNWFEQKEQDEQFKFWQMSTYQKFCYARYLVGVGLYNRITSINYQKTISYLTKALKVLDTLGDDYDYIYSKFNCSLNIALTHVYLGNIKTAEEIINEMEKLFKHRIEGGDIFILYHVKARIFFIQGKYNEALEYVNKGIEVWKTLDPNDLGFTRDYLLRAAILSSIGKYQEAYVQTQQVYNMHKSVNQEALGYIYTQMAKSELGLNKIDIALDHINKAITIFLADERRNPKNIDHLEDPDLAAGYVVQGDILLAQGNIKGSIESYKKAYAIYHYFYGDKSKNVVQVSELYNKGAKAACKNKDLYNYKFFGKPQIKEFGINHPNTIAMFEYCKQYDMDLWVKQD